MDFVMDQNFEREWVYGDDCRDALVECARQIENHWLTIVPRRTGALAASSLVDPEMTGDGWQAVLSTNTHYADYVEFGTRYMQAQHNLDKALQAQERS